jgi:hypothetical protein
MTVHRFNFNKCGLIGRKCSQTEGIMPSKAQTWGFARNAHEVIKFPLRQETQFIGYGTWHFTLAVRQARLLQTPGVKRRIEALTS